MILSQVNHLLTPVDAVNRIIVDYANGLESYEYDCRRRAEYCYHSVLLQLKHFQRGYNQFNLVFGDWTIQEYMRLYQDYCGDTGMLYRDWISPSPFDWVM